MSAWKAVPSIYSNAFNGNGGTICFDETTDLGLIRIPVAVVAAGAYTILF